MYLKLQMHKTESFVDFLKGLFVDIIKNLLVKYCTLQFPIISENNRSLNHLPACLFVF